MQLDECVFCTLETNRDDNNSYGRIANEELSTLVVRETANFRAVLDIAPLTTGHTLMIPRTHVVAMSFLSEEQWSDLSSLLDELGKKLQRKFSYGLTLFEHGMGRRGTTADCCIEHAHLHLVPTDMSVADDISRAGHRLLHRGDSYDDFRSFCGQEYLYYKAPDESHGRFYDAQRARSQYLRQVVGTRVGTTVWHWQDHLALSTCSDIVRPLRDAAEALTDGAE